MGNANEYYGKGQQFHFVFMPILFCDQQKDSDAKKTERHEPAMMLSIAMNQGNGPDAKGY
jgi:hypothetical protein